MIEELHLSVAKDRQHGAEIGAPSVELGQAGADLVVLDVEEPPAVGPTSPDGGAHDEGDPADMLGGNEAWTMVGSLANLTRVGMEAMGNAPSSAV